MAGQGRLRLLVPLAVLVAFALALAACGGSDEGSGAQAASVE